jgi:Calpain family cysteine protease
LVTSGHSSCDDGHRLPAGFSISLMQLKSMNHRGDVRYPRTRVNLADDVFLFTNTTSDPLLFRYEVESATFAAVTLTITFEGSENFCAIQNGKILSESYFAVTAAPFQRCIVGSLRPIDRSKSSRLKLNYEWEKVVSDDLQIARSNKISDREQERIRILIDQATLPISKFDQRKSRSYIDIEFPPVADSISKKQTGSPHDEWWKIPVTHVWRRPGDYILGSYGTFKGEIVPNNIRRGSLGDRGFQSAIACLAEHPSMIKNLFVSDSADDFKGQGQHSLRFCFSGIWDTVKIDEFVPCYPDSGPLFMRSHDNEIWQMLLQKAYAKVLGNYDALRTETAQNVLRNLTGSPLEVISRESRSTAQMVRNNTLWPVIKDYSLSGYLMSLSIPILDTNRVVLEQNVDQNLDQKLGQNLDQKTSVCLSGGRMPGLLAGYTYAILRVEEILGGIRLFKLRNPWGEREGDGTEEGTEWCGAWCDTSPLWTDEILVGQFCCATLVL